MLITLPGLNPKGLRVAIIGGGLMGHGLAAVFLAGGANVTVCEANGSVRDTLLERVRRVLEAMNRTASIAGRFSITSSLMETNPDCQLVIEAIPENLTLKQLLFAELEELLPSSILATNSSVYRVGDVSAQMRDASRAIGTHWWNPPHLVPIVEVIQGNQTGTDLVAWMMELLQTLGKTPLHVRRDTPGFIGNRLQHALWREAIALVEEGVADAATVDLVARQTIGLKLAVLGPLENADYVGLDLTLAIHEYVFPALSHATRPSPMLIDAVRGGNLGAKTGEGFLQWPTGQVERVAGRLQQQIEKTVSKEN